MEMAKIKETIEQKDEKYRRDFKSLYSKLLDFSNETSSRLYQKQSLVESLKDEGDDVTNETFELDTLREIREHLYAMKVGLEEIKNSLIVTVIQVDEISDFIYNNSVTYLYKIHCRIMDENENKERVEFPEYVTRNNVKSVDKWMREIDNYSSFYLNVIEKGITIEQYKIIPNE